MFAKLQLPVASFLGTRQIKAFGGIREEKIYRLPKRECLILASGYSVELRSKIIDRWLQLEQQAKQKSPAEMTRLEILQMAIESEQERIRLEGENQKLKEENRIIERSKQALLKSPNDYEVSAVAAFFRMKPRKELIPYLLENKLVYRPSDNTLRPYAQYRDRGYMYNARTNSPGGYPYTGLFFTPSGVSWLSNRLFRSGVIDNAARDSYLFPI